MLDGKFSVYNNSGGAPQAPSQSGKVSPILFKFESVQKAPLSFEDEMRQAVLKLQQGKEPSAFQKWTAESASKWFGFMNAEIHLPKMKNPIAPLFKAVATKIEESFQAIKFPTFPKVQMKEPLERLDKRIDNAKEKVKEWVEELWDKIPHEKIAEAFQFIAEIPQHTLVPLALWAASFIPAAAIKSSFESGVQRLAKFATASFEFGKKGYQFCERGVKKVALFAFEHLILPVANFLEKWLRRFYAFLLSIWNVVYPPIVRFSKNFPRHLWNFLKASFRGLKRVTVWLVE